MTGSRPVFIADTCIGGLSVVKSLWNSGTACDAFFMADYVVNPLGLKSDAAIADVANRWLVLAEQQSDTLVVACNTLSIRYSQLLGSQALQCGLTRIVTMVDCLEAMANIEADLLANRKVLVIGTAFTASQPLYPEILSAAAPGIRIDTVAATRLERKIARFEHWSSKEVFTGDLRQAIENTEIAVLACTCFPMVQAELASLFPGVTFLDPGAYCAGFLYEKASAQDRNLHIKVTGEVVSSARVTEFAESYLGSASILPNGAAARHRVR